MRGQTWVKNEGYAKWFCGDIWKNHLVLQSLWENFLMYRIGHYLRWIAALAWMLWSGHCKVCICLVAMYYGDWKKLKVAEKWYRSSKEVWNMFVFIFFLLLQFSEWTGVWVIFATMVVLILCQHFWVTGIQNWFCLMLTVHTYAKY